MIKLTIMKGTEVVTVFESGESKIKLGRMAENDVVLDSPSVSRQHAVIDSKSNQYTIADMFSSNGTAVNKKLIDSCQLSSGDEVEISPFLIQVEIIQE